MFPRTVGLIHFWVRIFLTKFVALLLAVAGLRVFPMLHPRMVVLLASTVLLPIENYFAIFPRARAIGDIKIARWISYVPVLREIYVTSLLIQVRSPASCIYANPFDEDD